MDKLFFKPDHAWVGDLIPYYENGTYYAYYLHDPRIPRENLQSRQPGIWPPQRTAGNSGTRARPLQEEGMTGQIRTFTLVP